MNAAHGRPGEQGNTAFHYAPLVIPGQTAAVILLLHHSCHRTSGQDKLPGHDQSHISAAQNQNVSAQGETLEIYHPLGLTSSENPRRASAGERQSPNGDFTAASSQYQSPKSNFFHSSRTGEQCLAIRTEGENSGVQSKNDGGGLYPGCPAGGILRPGHFPVENTRAKAGVEALRQYAAQLYVPIGQENRFCSRFPGGEGCRHSCRASPHHQYVTVHGAYLPTADCPVRPGSHPRGKSPTLWSGFPAPDPRTNCPDTGPGPHPPGV